MDPPILNRALMDLATAVDIESGRYGRPSRERFVLDVFSPRVFLGFSEVFVSFPRFYYVLLRIFLEGLVVSCRK